MDETHVLRDELAVVNGKSESGEFLLFSFRTGNQTDGMFCSQPSPKPPRRLKRQTL